MVAAFTFVISTFHDKLGIVNKTNNIKLIHSTYPDLNLHPDRQVSPETHIFYRWSLIILYYFPVWQA